MRCDDPSRQQSRDRQGADSHREDDATTPPALPLAYLLTFTCYGTWLHGNEHGSVDRHHSSFGAPLVEPDAAREHSERERLAQQPYYLDAARRDIVLEALKHVCVRRGWALLAAHVRSNHVHVVVETDEPPEGVLNALKAHASRALNEAGLDDRNRKRWTRHGSTAYLWDDESVDAAVDYTLHDQGEPMAAFDGTASPTEPDLR